uniref:Cation transporter n=1 Tax=Janibacter limosus TaxID=53458 RepID=A0AC61U2B6_9MICO|nr:cation transporter [Janibacter limosus]
MSADVHPPGIDARRLRRIVLVVALLNFAYFFVEFTVALGAGSVSLLADSVDFLEDTAINLLIFVALGWPLARRALMGKAMALVILGPATVAGIEAVRRFADPVAPEVLPVVLASLGAIVVNGTSGWLLAGVRHAGGLAQPGGLPLRPQRRARQRRRHRHGRGDAVDLVGLARPRPRLRHHPHPLHAAWEVWEVSEEERLAAKAPAGEEID